MKRKKNYSSEHSLPPDLKEMFFQLVFNSLEEYAIFTTDKEGYINSWNSGGENLLGYKEDEITGSYIGVLFTEEDKMLNDPKKEMDAAVKNGKGSDERFHVRKDGTKFWASGLIFPLKDEKNNFCGFTKIMRDLTERKQKEDQLKASNEYAEGILNTIRESLLVLNKDFTIDKVNKRFLNNFGLEEKEIYGKPFFGIDEANWNNEKLKEVVKKVLTNGDAFTNFEMAYPSSKLTHRYLHVHGSIFKGLPNQEEQLLLVIEDVTDNKALEQHRNDFIGIVSHELKSPLTSIKAFCQLLQNKLKDKIEPNYLAMLDNMNKQTNRLSRRINELLDATKIDGGKLQVSLDYFDLDEVIREVKEEMQKTTSTKIVIPEISASCQVYGDRERTRQVLINLISNAIKYSPGKEKIMISMETGEKMVKCCVHDFGIGIAAHELHHVFQRYFRVSHDQSISFEGIGLGLYLSSEIMNLQNGNITADSEEGKGSTFCFNIPKEKEADDY